jgi:signal transduction histidine kinase
MSPSQLRGWTVAVLSLASFAFLSVLSFTYGDGGGPGGLIYGVGMLAFGLVGAFIIVKVPGNRIGWVFAVIGILAPFSAFQQLAFDLLESGVDTGLVAVGQLVGTAGWNAFFVCMLVLVPLWYPSGTAINRYFGMVAPVAIAGWVMLGLSEMGGATVSILVDGSLPTDEGAWMTVANPFSHWPIPDLAAFDVGFLIIGVSALFAVASMIVRTVRSRGTERLQMKWLLLSEGLFVAFAMLSVPFEDQLDTVGTGGQLIIDLILGALVLAVPISVGFAITKHRLYEIDVIISRTVTYGALALFITGAYALVVVGIGTLVGAESNLALSIAAVAVVAVAFEPLRDRLQRWANRLVFGERATPYEVLSQATARFAGADTAEDALEQVTQLVVEGTGAAEAVLWLKVGGNLQPRASTPPTVLEGLADVRMNNDDVPELSGDASTLVRHGGEILGALSISKPRGESVTDMDDKMLHDIASGTGLLVRNISLNAELAERAEQLRLSRRRLVAAHDAERHRLERDLHDGAQQQVVAIKVKLGIAGTLAGREGAPKVESLVSSLAVETQVAVDAMRAVAHGIYPPLLEAEGLGAALTAARRAFPIGVDLEIDGIGRYGRSVEESLYFCSVETVTRAVDGGATWALIEMKESAGSVAFSVRHDGEVGNLISVRDRVEAFGGWLAVDGGGIVTGQLRSSDSKAVTV